jgi:hypothetical protein
VPGPTGPAGATGATGASGISTLTGDVSGLASANIVDFLTGTGGTVTIPNGSHLKQLDATGFFSTTGTIRTSPSFSIIGRNPTNTLDIRLLAYDGANNINIGEASGVANIALNANQFTFYTVGAAYEDAATINWRGASHTGAMTWDFSALPAFKGTIDPAVTFTLEQTTAASDVATKNISLNPQAPFGAAVTNINGGDVIVNTPVSISGATKFGGFQIRRNNVPIVRIGQYSSSGAYGGIWFTDGDAPSTTNYSFLGNGSSSYFNAASNHIFTIGGSSYPMVLDNAKFAIGAGAYTVYMYQWDTSATAVQHFTNNATSATIKYDQAAAGAGATFIIQGQNAAASSASAGGKLLFESGSGDGAGLAGDLSLQLGATERAKLYQPNINGGLLQVGGGANFKALMGPLVAYETTYVGFWGLANATAPVATNIMFESDGNNLVLNGPGAGGSILFYVNATGMLAGRFNGSNGDFLVGPYTTEYYRFERSATSIFHFQNSATTATIRYDIASAGSGAAFTIQGQDAAVASAGNGGNLVLTPGLKDGAGTNGNVVLSLLAGLGAGYATISNTGIVGFTSTISGGAVTLAGDVTGLASANTVVKVNGATVPASGALTTGNVLQVTGAAALGYAAVNLAGGANFVTGVLPTGNQAAQTMGGDVGGTTAASTITALALSKLAAGTGGTILVSASPGGVWTERTASGDATISATGVIAVTKVNGTTVPAGGALTTGNGLYVTGVGALSYSALNLAGGANYVTGVLPTGNQAAQTMGGDVGGTTAASTITALALSKLAGGTDPAGGTMLLSSAGAGHPWTEQTMGGDATIVAAGTVTVSKIHGATVPAAGALTTGNGLYVTGVGALSYSALNLAGGANYVTGVLPTGNQASQSMAGDVTGTTAANTVISVTGSAGILAISSTAAILQWAAATSSPTLRTADAGSGAGSTLSIISQKASSGAGGNVVIQAGAGVGGADGYISLKANTTTVAWATAAGLTLFAGLTYHTITVTTPSPSVYTLDSTGNDCLVFADTTSNAIIIKLPAPTAGRIIIIKDSGFNAAANNITIQRYSAEKIEGVAASRVLSSNGMSITLTSNGTDWFTIA